MNGTGLLVISQMYSNTVRTGLLVISQVYSNTVRTELLVISQIYSSTVRIGLLESHRYSDKRPLHRYLMNEIKVVPMY